MLPDPLRIGIGLALGQDQHGRIASRRQLTGEFVMRLRRMEEHEIVSLGQGFDYHPIIGRIAFGQLASADRHDVQPG